MSRLGDEIMRLPAAGHARDGQAGTLDVFLSGLRRVWPDWTGERLLDVGCGTGFFTFPAGADFREIHGIDVNADYVSRFNAHAPDLRYQGHLVDASKLPFPDRWFDAVMTLETLEHVADLDGVVREIARILRPGGNLIITVPNRFFPMEVHGGTLMGITWSRVPFLNWFPPLHRRIAAARVFTAGALDRHFLPHGFSRISTCYLWPTFEHSGGRLHNNIQKIAKPLYRLMRAMEKSPKPLQIFGSSVVVRYRRN
jgi:SAM-dependent methyltransferase